MNSVPKISKNTTTHRTPSATSSAAVSATVFAYHLHMVGCMLSSNVVRNFDGRPRAVCKCAFSVTFSVKVMTHWKVFFRKYSFRKSLSKENFPVCHDLYIGCEPVATMQSIHWSPIIAVQTGALYSPPPHPLQNV